MRGWLLGIAAAVVLHAAILLFGGVLFPQPDPADAVEEVDLLADVETAAPEAVAEPAEAPEPEMQVEPETPPEMPEIVEPASPIAPEDLVPRLDALSLEALASALDPTAAGAGGFGGAFSLASGGRIGGSGSVDVAVENAADAVFDIGALDQRPRVLHQPPPVYPADLRQQKIEGTVYVVFVVDRDGRVIEPAVESAPHEGLQAPALEAVRRWKFEPAVVRGEKVLAKVRVPIRFSLAS